ncbi:MAG: hypothetical protein JXA60_11475 [Candidatus Coatesbacteria bacterium]|nr:hypothetical protein [Candidatus Coatesbacteria bacterium]
MTENDKFCPECKSPPPKIWQKVDLENIRKKIRKAEPKSNAFRNFEETKEKESKLEFFDYSRDQDLNIEKENRNRYKRLIIVGVFFMFILFSIIAYSIYTDAKNKEVNEEFSVKEEEKGLIQDDGTYGFGEEKNGKKVGKWNFKSANGILLRTEEFDSNGLNINSLLIYYPNGNIKEKRYITVGKQDSLEEYSETGVLMKKGSLKDNLPHGEWQMREANMDSAAFKTVYYLEGKEVSKQQFDMLRNAQANPVLVHEGEEKEESKGFTYIGKKKDNKRDGVWRVVDAKGSLREEITYENGIREGENKKYSQKTDGTYEIRIYKNDILISGKWYNKENKILSEGKYKNNQRHGIWILYNYMKNSDIPREKKTEYNLGKEVKRMP